MSTRVEWMYVISSENRNLNVWSANLARNPLHSISSFKVNIQESYCQVITQVLVVYVLVCQGQGRNWNGSKGKEIDFQYLWLRRCSNSRVEEYIQKNKEWLITATRNSLKTNSKTTSRKQKLWEKTADIAHEMTCSLLSRGSLKWETKSFLIAAENCSIWTNYIKAKIDNTQQNHKWRLYGNKDKTVDCKINKCNKLARREYQTTYDCVGKVIHWELCKRLIFGLTIK